MENKAKLIFIPTPGHGHIMSTIQIAKLLVNRNQNLSVTVLVIKPPTFGSSSPTTTYIESLAKNTTSRISFIELPQEDLPPGDSKSHLSFFKDFIESHCKYVRNIVTDIVSQPDSGRLTGFVIDMFCTSMIDIANEFNVPSYVFFTSNAALLGFKFYIEILNQSQDLVELSNSDTEVSVPSYAKPLPTKVFWDIVHTKEGVDYILTVVKKLREVKGIMVNTFSDLETHALKSLFDDINVPPVYPVGPILNLESVAAQPSDDGDDIIKWLDRQPPSSVVFLCFGSMGTFNEIQVKEIARGLEQSGHRFLWSLRQPPSNEKSRVPGNYEDPGTVLPEGFLERTKGIGKVIGWAPQTAVLAHDAVGGFVSHCGWNSLLESLWFGVPTATWPMFAEQQMNAFKMAVEMGLAVEIKLDYRNMFHVKADPVIVTAEEIESGIRRLMEDNEVRTKVKAMSQKSRAAMAEGGSSYASVGCFLRDVIGNIS